MYEEETHYTVNEVVIRVFEVPLPHDGHEAVEHLPRDLELLHQAQCLFEKR